MKNAILFTSILLLFSCKKEKELVEPEITPPLYITGTYDGNSVDYKIGENDYFMETDFEKIVIPGGTSAVYTIKSYLSQKDSFGYPNSLQLIMYANVNDTLEENFDVNSFFNKSNDIRVNDNFSDTNNEMVVHFGDNIDTNPVYLSSFVPQENYFKVTSVEPYKKNKYGQKTVKVGFTLNCLVARIGVAPKRLTIKGFFAFAYPS